MVERMLTLDFPDNVRKSIPLDTDDPFVLGFFANNPQAIVRVQKRDHLKSCPNCGGLYWAIYNNKKEIQCMYCSYREEKVI